MTSITDPEEIGKWLDQNPTYFASYFIKKADITLINRWLTEHGYVILCEGNTGRKSPVLLGPPSERRGSRSTCSSRRASGASSLTSDTLSPTSPPERGSDFLSTTTTTTTTLANTSDDDHNNGSGKAHHSKKTLRNDFARAKSRSVFQNEESSLGHHTPASLASRRSSLKDMRKYTSLPPNSINILSLLIESKVKLPRYASKHFELKRELRRFDDRAFFLDIVKDIANDLDLRSLTKKIIENVTILLDAESASFFILQGPRGKQTLVSKVWDVPIGSPWTPSAMELDGVEVGMGAGHGILGWVAERGEPVNLESPTTVLQDPRYKVGAHPPTHSLLAMPVRSPGDEEVIAVAQVVNKNQYFGTFSLDDQKLLETYLQFVGIALTNAQIMEATRREYDRNRNLLEVVHDLFEEQTSLESVILKIMQRAQRLLKCERAAVLLLDEHSSELSKGIKFSKLFELNTPLNGHPTADLQTMMQTTDAGKVLDCQASGNMMRLAEQVVSSGEVINIAEIVEVEPSGCGDNLRSLLAMPIRNRNSEIIGVATIVNKLNAVPFDDQDEQLFEAFTIFCGLGISNTLTYGDLEMAIARQKVAIEVLSYHAAASIKDVELLLGREVPDADELGLVGLDFDDFSLDGDTMVLAALRMFTDLSLVSRFKMDNATLIRWILTIQRNYRDVPYHNWRHAWNVCQVMFAILTSCEMKDTFSELEVLGMFVACLCHDLDHRGTNNAFQAKTGSALALLYGTQNTMEQHHYHHAVMIINSEGHNIFSGLGPEDYSRVMNVLRQCILATDLTTYFQRRSTFFSLVSESRYSWDEEGQRETLRFMLMTASDLAASTKRWEVQRRVAELVTAEFFAQGDQERKQLQITPPASMDREREHELPQLQMRWISDICLPLYQSLSDMNPRFGVMRDGASVNMKVWAKLAGVDIDDEDASKASS
ncbi:dual 3',5'-cyclic-AMP and -GMP phosphodiesterase 11A [Folsomia candida]|uniref:dual 3',5'-cyclic-AMP and -GMP phosphodiesterase 11A n=1 Tax=Folsomia candida TaxID=158441 RepID=UPI001604D26D|nr:dual 3',5'-cyclic-AMP and -GMP phosphodiesterase 11A [Folsomia candida]XP_035701981.1 dual 3',5'-cyclic-AMP and -GMP phosphodiesterase 11A [Folsomia candida]